jgi:hypothetical protein
VTPVPAAGQFRPALSSVLSSHRRQVADIEKAKVRRHRLFGSDRRALPVRSASFKRTRRFRFVHCESFCVCRRAGRTTFEREKLDYSYDDLNERYFPFRDCEADALLEVIRGSGFIRSISYGSRTKEYFIHFTSDKVLVGFGYLVSEKKSTFNTALRVHK